MADYQEGEVLVNPQTGERVQLVRGEWKPLLAQAKEQVQNASAKPDGVTGQGLARGAMLGLRDLMSGATAAPGMVADVVSMPATGLRNLATAGYNKITGSNIPARPMIGGNAQDLEQVLDAAGYPKPESDTERMLSAMTRGVAGAATGMGAGAALGAAASANAGAQRLAQMLTAAPKTQLAAGAASPAAGEAVRQAGGGPVAQTAAELATGLVVASPSAVMRQVPTTATTEQLRNASRAAYKAAEQAGAVFKPTSYDAFVTGMLPDIRKAGFDSALHPKASAVIDRLQAEMGKPQTLENMEILRRISKIAAASPEKSERNIASIIEDHLDNFVANAGPNDIIGGNPQVAVPALQQARSLYSKASKSDTIETLLDRAALSAPNYSASGMENAIRIEFRALAKNQNRMRLFSPDEQEAIRKVAMGGPVENTLRMLGKFAPTGVVSTALSTGTGAMFGGPIGAAALPIAGMAARQGAAAMTKRNADLAAALMRGGKLPKTGINRDQLAAALAAMAEAQAAQEQ